MITKTYKVVITANCRSKYGKSQFSINKKDYESNLSTNGK